MLPERGISVITGHSNAPSAGNHALSVASGDAALPPKRVACAKRKCAAGEPCLLQDSAARCHYRCLARRPVMCIANLKCLPTTIPGRLDVRANPTLAFFRGRGNSVSFEDSCREAQISSIRRGSPFGNDR